MTVTQNSTNRVDDPKSSQLVPPRPARAGVDRVDDMIVVTRARAWIGLAIVVLLVAGLVVWALFAQVRITETAKAVALRNGAFSAVTSPVDGTVTEIRAPVSTKVSKGSVVAVVTNTDGTSTALVSPSDGVVLSIRLGVGSVVRTGDVVVRIEQDGPIRIRLFPSLPTAEQIAVGDEALVQFDAFGATGPSVTGEVVSIDPVPMTRADVAASLGDAALADFVVSGGAVVDVEIRVDEDELAKLAPDAGQFRGAVTATVTLILGSEHPIDFVLS